MEQKKLCQAKNKDQTPCIQPATKTGFCRPHSRKDGGGRKKKSGVEKTRKKNVYYLYDIAGQIDRMFGKIEEYYKLIQTTNQPIINYQQTQQKMVAATQMVRKEHNDKLLAPLKKAFHAKAEKLQKQEEK